MTLSDIKNSIFRRTETNATSFPAADMVIALNAANDKVSGKIRRYLDNFRPTAWTTTDLSTGTATPVFDADFHDLISLYVCEDQGISRNLPGTPGWQKRIAELEARLIEWYGTRNYEVFTVTIAAPGVVTKDNHGLQTNDRVTLVTSGALPTGLSADTFYYVIYVTEHTFKLASTRDGTAITTTGSQSGTHYYASDRAKRIRAGSQDNR